MQEIKFEDVFTHDYLEPPVVVIDLRVEIFMIMSKIRDVPECDQADAILAHWSRKINNPLPWLPMPETGYRVCLVDDYKDEEGNYWRNSYFPEYKKGRPEKPKAYNAAHDIILRYLAPVECPIPVFRQKGFEADDFAGVFFREKDPLMFDQRQMILNTVDTDWMQLIDDNKGILWATPHPKHLPRLRSEFEIYVYFKRLGLLAYSPEDVVKLKYEKGDPTDNYGPGSPMEIITLREPPLVPHFAPLKCFLESSSSNTSYDHHQQATNWLWRKGYN